MLRAGSRCLSIFTNSLNARVLHAHGAGPLRPKDLDEALGWAPQSSLRAVVNSMCELGTLTRTESGEGANSVTELTAAGRELLPVADALETWLHNAPGTPIPIDDVAAYGTIRVLTAGWDSAIVRALAERPHSLIELNAEISAFNYPALKRRLAKLRATHLAIPTGSTSTYTASEWLRQAVAPLILAGRWERRHDPEALPITKLEIEAAFLLALPLLELPFSRPSGTCALAVLTPEEDRSRQTVAGVTVEVDKGRLVSCRTGTGTNQKTWALGAIDAWQAAVIDGDRDAIRFSGAKPRLAENLVKALHTGLFPPAIS